MQELILLLFLLNVFKVIKYKLSLDSSLKEEANDFYDAEIEVDNNTGEILNFKFDLSKYLSSLLALDAVVDFKHCVLFS